MRSDGSRAAAVELSAASVVQHRSELAATLRADSCLAWNVLQAFGSPLSRPRRNQVTRCSDEPCVKRSGATRPVCIRWMRSSPIAAAALRPASTSPVSRSRGGCPRPARRGGPRRRRSSRPAAPARPTARSADRDAPTARAAPARRCPSATARGGRARARSRTPARNRLARRSGSAARRRTRDRDRPCGPPGSRTARSPTARSRSRTDTHRGTAPRSSADTGRPGSAATSPARRP